MSARPVVSETAYRATAQATDGCDDGGCNVSYLAVSYNTPLQDFAKEISDSPVSIAEPFAYTITSAYYGAVTYTSTQIVDTLPTVDGQQVFSYTEIVIEHEGPETWAADTDTVGAITFTPTGGENPGAD